MAKKTTKKKAPAKKKYHSDLYNEAQFMIQNGLSEAIMGFNPADIGTQLNQVDTIFANNRWYLISNMRQILSEIYVEHGIIQTIVDVPVDDGMRGGVKIISKQLSEENIQKLETVLDRENDFNVVSQALKWNRLYGGAGIVIITDQDYTTPLDLTKIDKGAKLKFRAVDMWELFWDKQNTEGYNMELQQQDYEFYSYYGKRLHKSRVLKMKGFEAPSFIRPRLRGWGLSVVEKLVRSINQYLKANNLTFEVLDEFKVDVYKIKDLYATLMDPAGEAKVFKRVQVANQQKNFQNAITMDAQDDYDHKELSFTGIAETMAGIRMQIASDLRMPLTKVFGISSAGFNSGEDDIENYNAMVESEIRQKAKFDILRMIEIRCQQQFGFIPDDLSIEFKPLRILSAEQEETVKTQKFNRLMMALEKGVMSVVEFKNAVNGENLLGVQLDTSVEEVTPLDGGSSEGEGEEVGVNDEGQQTGGVKKVSDQEKSQLTAKEAPVAKN